VQQHPTALLIRRSVLEKLGGYDNRLFACYCDADLGVRIWKLGYRVMYAPRGKLWHKVHKSPKPNFLEISGIPDPIRAYLVARNRIIFLRKHSSLGNFARFCVAFLPAYFAYYSMITIASRRRDCTFAFWRGTYHGLRAAVNGLSYIPFWQRVSSFR
jgi:GT2 family glycosyltransferase